MSAEDAPTGPGTADDRLAERVEDLARILARQAGTVERLLVGRGGTVVTPAVGAAFDAALMEAADVVATEDEAEDRTVAEVLAPGLSVPARNVRPARVVVRAFRSA